jgi:CRISPR-associated protein Cmr5
VNKTNQSGRQTIEQERAAQAWDAIKQAENQKYSDEKEKKKTQDHYGSRAKKLPAMIQINGLAATLAYLLSKSEEVKEIKNDCQLIYDHLSERMNNYFPLPDDNDLMVWIHTASMDQYRRATAEAIEYANWLKRYVEFMGWKSSEGD